MTAIKLHTEVINPVYRKHLKNSARTQIFYGGSSSGKSVFLAQRAVFDLLAGGRNYLITRQVGRTLRGSVFTEILKVLNDWNVADLFSVNKSDMLITCENGYQAIFAGLDDVAKLKSLTPAKGALTDIWVEEATETERASIKELLKRQRGGSEKVPKRLTLSFNPILQAHWIYEEYFSPIAWADDQTEYRGDGLSILKTTYKDNQFLPASDVADLESETDAYYRDVYTLGKWGVLGNVIFTNWVVADLADPGSEYYLPEAQRTNRRHGLDFGFSSDPAAVPLTHYDRAHKRIYVYDELYETGLTNDVLAEILKTKLARDVVKADSAEPKSVAELRIRGLNVYPARKGIDSVLFGIQWLQQQTLVVDAACVHMRNELQQYKWREDAQGRAMRQPVDRNNHLIDGLRYAYEDEMLDQNPEYLPAIYK
jgi:phage terminase large subunit